MAILVGGRQEVGIVRRILALRDGFLTGKVV
jgi:hypothetical protein